MGIVYPRGIDYKLPKKTKKEDRLLGEVQRYLKWVL